MYGEDKSVRDERNEKIIQDYKLGMRLRDLTDKYHVTRQRIYQLLKEIGIKANRHISRRYE